MAMMDVEIVIVTFNAAEKLRRCVDSIFKNTEPWFRLTIVDNASSDGTGEYLRRLSHRGVKVKVVANDANVGFSKAANEAMKASGAEYIALLDDDVEVTPRWLEGLYRHMSKDYSIKIAGPKVLYPDGTIHSADAIPHTWMFGYLERDLGQRDYVKTCEGLAGPCWLMRRELVDEGILFDEGYFPCQGEDFDYCLQVRSRGYRLLYCGDVRVIHHNLKRDGGFLMQNIRRLNSKWFSEGSPYDRFDVAPEARMFIDARKYAYEDEYGKSLDSLQEAERLLPGFVPLLLFGECSLGLGDIETAVRLLEEYKRLAPAHPDAYHLLWRAYVKLGETQKARDNAKSLLGLTSLQELEKYLKYRATI
jgi:GT2 family glycosyltransferase